MYSTVYKPEDQDIGEFVSDETAVEPDLPMTDEEVGEVFFHADRIAEFIAKSE